MHTVFVPSTENQVGEYLYKTPIEGLLFIQSKRFDDNRGFYAEVARLPEIEAELNVVFRPQQLNLSHSKQYVTRGLHAENWQKLLTVTRGECFCAWADVRPNSPTFGDSVSLTLGPDSQYFGSVFVSAGIANSFCTLSPDLDYLYTVDALYAERDTSQDVAISLFDSELNIPWPIEKDKMIISERDLTAITLQQKYPEASIRQPAS